MVRRTRRAAARSASVFTIGFALVALVPGAAAALEPVTTTPNFESAPSGSQGYTTYVSNTEAHPRRTNTYLLPDGGSPIRINEAGTRGGTAGIDGDTIVYAEDGDLRFYEISSGTRSEVPDGINTARTEADPSLSGEWLLFSRHDFELTRRIPSRVILWNLTTGEKRVLARSRFYSVFAEQVSGMYAAYTDGNDEYRYDIAAETSTSVPGRGRRFRYGAGSITPDGTLYVVRGPFRCGGGYEIRRFELDGTLTTIYEFPRRKQIAWKTFAYEDGGGTTLVLDRLHCPTGESNIYRLENADSL